MLVYFLRSGLAFLTPNIKTLFCVLCSICPIIGHSRFNWGKQRDHNSHEGQIKRCRGAHLEYLQVTFDTFNDGVILVCLTIL